MCVVVFVQLKQTNKCQLSEFHTKLTRQSSIAYFAHQMLVGADVMRRYHSFFAVVAIATMELAPMPPVF